MEFCRGSDQTWSKRLEMVLDFSEWGEVIGVEIISLAYHTGKNCLELISKVLPASGCEPRFSYDEDCDAFGLTLSPGPSMDQKAVDGTVCLDGKGRIISLSAEWEEPERKGQSSAPA